MHSSPGPRSRDQALCDAVLAYLAEHPMAMDTMEGIAEWWIAHVQLRVELDNLARALRRLCDLGLIEEFDAGGSRCYRLVRPGNGS